MAEQGTDEEYTESMVAFAEGVVAVIDLFDQDTAIAEYGEIGNGLKAMAEEFSARRNKARESTMGEDIEAAIAKKRSHKMQS